MASGFAAPSRMQATRKSLSDQPRALSAAPIACRVSGSGRLVTIGNR